MSKVRKRNRTPQGGKMKRFSCSLVLMYFQNIHIRAHICNVVRVRRGEFLNLLLSTGATYLQLEDTVIFDVPFEHNKSAGTEQKYVKCFACHFQRVSNHVAFLEFLGLGAAWILNFSQNWKRDKFLQPRLAARRAALTKLIIKSELRRISQRDEQLSTF